MKHNLVILSDTKIKLVSIIMDSQLIAIEQANYVGYNTAWELRKRIWL